MDSPYINHFIQPDTIIPNPSNPQSWNRYSYVGNNPVRFNDPTGHMQEDDDYECHGCAITPESDDQGDIVILPEDDGSGGCVTIIGQNNCDETSEYDVLLDLLPTDLCGSFGVDPILCDEANWNALRNELQLRSMLSTVDLGSSLSYSSWTHGLSNSFYLLGSITQDLATTGDGLFIIATIAAISAGCSFGPAGCVGAAIDMEIAYLSGPKQVMDGLVATSFFLTGAGDLLDDGELGEATATSFSTMAVGAISLDPFSSFALNAYGSGYNHGLLNGVVSISNGAPLFKDK